MTIVGGGSKVKGSFFKRTKDLCFFEGTKEGAEEKGTLEMESVWVRAQTRSWWRLRDALSPGRRYPASCGIGERMGKKWTLWCGREFLAFLPE